MSGAVFKYLIIFKTEFFCDRGFLPRVSRMLLMGDRRLIHNYFMLSAMNTDYITD